ncbi:alpha-N-acetylglucosaminidase isoform X2 [Nilaparvata lugens]|uniref:alpha-N-acetylglucosaminidase isoform X2 n=1 Tax=Nilaparvata lugens TaxID=108931 RepID=UPI000B9912D1|nr:alpha-N-acetylglucosaminidase isoform X2 [Nilaparvata lugens]
MFFINNVFVFLSFVSMSTSMKNFEDTLGHINTKSNAETQQKAVEDLIKRLLPGAAYLFKVNIDPHLSDQIGKDKFTVCKVANDIHVTISATTGVAAAWGFHHYLKYYCHCHVSWDADQLKLPHLLPEANFTEMANDRFRYYQNVCTSSYSFVWWSKERWVREIDWMAMNGINLALAFNAQEAIWREVYLDLGLTEEEIAEHFTGPAFSAWGRMGNIRGWAGPLSSAWHSKSIVLQKLILKQMRNIGIIPILPAFAGQVPVAFKRLFPNASLETLQKWNRFQDEYCCPLLLSPEDPLFQKVGKQFLKKYIERFGTDHVYNCDTFNEMTPPSGDVDYLSSIGKATYKAMTVADPDAIWVLQGWFLHSDNSFWNKQRAEALFTSVEAGKMIVLDLHAELFPQYETFDSFFGQPFIWCMLHNFGGTLGLQGSAENLNLGPFKARIFANSSMIGTGLTPEGINQNYIVYDIMSEVGYRQKPMDLNLWFQQYSIRRYGVDNKFSKEMWTLLKNSIYSYNGPVSLHGKYILVHQPSLKLSKIVWFDICTVADVWKNAIASINTWPSSTAFTETFKYDVVDITREALRLLIDESYERIVSYVDAKNIPLYKNETVIFLSLMQSMIELLSSHEKFLLQNWINASKNLSSTAEESANLEMNARNQITLWGPNGEIKDYAAKQWAGLVKHYYKPRWELFFKLILEALENHKGINEHIIREKIFNTVEKPFSDCKTMINETYTGNPIETAKKTFQQWQNKFNCSNVPPFTTRIG